MFKIFLHRTVKKTLHNLPRHILKRFYELLTDLKVTPIPCGK